MTERILEIHNIASADGWYFEFTGDREADMEPVACFALISVINVDHPSLGVEKIVIGIGAEDFDGLIDSEVKDKYKMLIHKSKI